MHTALIHVYIYIYSTAATLYIIHIYIHTSIYVHVLHACMYVCMYVCMYTTLYGVFDATLKMCDERLLSNEKDSGYGSLPLSIGLCFKHTNG